MKRFTPFLALLLVGLSALSTFAQYRSASDGDLLLSNYLVDFGQIAIGKIVRGENMLKSVGTALYSAAPSAILHHQAMKIAGRNWKNAFTAQLVAQKGNQIVRRSILNRSLFSMELVTENELDFLFINMRVRGYHPELRINFWSLIGGTVGLALRDWSSESETYRFNIRHSLLTGVQMYDSKLNNELIVEGVTFSGSVATSGNGVMTHEIEHYFQSQRHNAFWDVVFDQDFAQDNLPLKWMRLDFGHMTSLASLLFSGGRHDERWIEWEANGYARLSER